MKNFNWEDFKKGNIEVGCKTKELAKDFFSKCVKQNIEWNDNTKINPETTYWECEKENTIYGIWRASEGNCFSNSGKLYYGIPRNKDKQVIEWRIEEDCDIRTKLLKDNDFSTVKQYIVDFEKINTIFAWQVLLEILFKELKIVIQEDSVYFEQLKDFLKEV